NAARGDGEYSARSGQDSATGCGVAEYFPRNSSRIRGDGRISLAILPSVAEFSRPVPSPTSPAGGGYRAQRHQLLESPAEGALRDLRPNALMDLRRRGVGIARHVFHDEGTKAMRLDPLERRLLIEACIVQQARRHVVARAARAPRLHDQAQLYQSPQPRAQLGGFGHIEAVRQLCSGHALGLAEQAQSDALTLGELMSLIGIGYQPHDARMQDASLDRH